MATIDAIEIPKLLFDEGAAPGTPASTNVALYAKADGLLYSKDDAGAETLVSGGPATGIPVGTSMPGGPSTNQLIYRTDLGLVFFYNGTRWLSLTLYRDQGGNYNSTGTGSQVTGRIAPWSTTYDLWLETIYVTAYVATTNTGSHYWNMAFRKITEAVAATTLVTLNTSAQSADNFVHQTSAIGALMGTTHKVLDMAASAGAGTPGQLSVTWSFNYRLVGT